MYLLNQQILFGIIVLLLRILSLLTYIIAHITDKKPGFVSIIIGDAHIYENHIEQVKIQLERVPYELPTLKINKKYSNINDYKVEDFEIENYKCHETIKAEMIA